MARSSTDGKRSVTSSMAASQDSRPVTRAMSVESWPSRQCWRRRERNGSAGRLGDRRSRCDCFYLAPRFPSRDRRIARRQERRLMEQVSEQHTCAPRVIVVSEKRITTANSPTTSRFARDLMGRRRLRGVRPRRRPSPAASRRRRAVQGLLHGQRQARDLELDTRTTLLDALARACISRAPTTGCDHASAAPAR